MPLDFALLTFSGVNSAVKAFDAARDRSGPDASWPSEVGFVEHHENGHVVLRGTFAGHYVDVDEALHTSGRGTEEGVAIGAVIGTLVSGPLGLAVGSVLGGTIGSQVGQASQHDPEPGELVERLRSAVPRSASAIVVIADPHHVDDVIAAVGDSSGQLIRKTLTPEEAALTQASLSASPAASPRPSVEGEEAVEASEAGPA